MVKCTLEEDCQTIFSKTEPVVRKSSKTKKVIFRTLVQALMNARHRKRDVVIDREDERNQQIPQIALYSLEVDKKIEGIL